jgi:hypothetical protein
MWQKMQFILIKRNVQLVYLIRVHLSLLIGIYIYLFWTEDCGENVGVCCESACPSCKRLQPGKENVTTASTIQVKIYQTQIYGRLLLLELAQLILIGTYQIQIGLLAQIQGCVSLVQRTGKGNGSAFPFHNHKSYMLCTHVLLLCLSSKKAEN